MRSFLLGAGALTSLLAPSLAAQSTAHVNDARSHGAVADAFLSLDEAIRLLNEDLTVAQLSAAELAQITGTGPILAVEIDAATVPTITLQGELTAIDGPASHDHVEVQAHGATHPVLVATGQAVGLRVRTNHAHLHGLVIRGGQIGVIAETTAHMHAGEMLELMELHFEAQTVAGLRIQSTSDMTHVMLRDAAFEHLATGIVVDDRTTSTGVMLMGWNVSFDDVQLGVDVYCAADGATTMARLDFARMTASGQYLRCRRTPQSSQRIMMMLVSSQIATTGDAVDIQGNAIGETLFHHHHSDIRPGQGRRAMYLWPQDTRFDWHGSENVVYGDIEISAGRLNRRLWAWNSVFRDGTFTMSNTGTRPSMRWNRFENCTIRAAATNSSLFAMSSSEFVGCTLDGQSAFGAINLENCWLDQTASTGTVQISSPAPTRWLANSSTTTPEPLIGTHIDLTLDLPPGMAGVWHIGLAEPDPLLTEEPWRFYMQTPTLLPLPGVFVGYTTLRLPLPNVRSIANYRFYAQPVTVPFLGQTHVPAFNLPRGVHITPRR